MKDGCNCYRVTRKNSEGNLVDFDVRKTLKGARGLLHRMIELDFGVGDTFGIEEHWSPEFDFYGHTDAFQESLELDTMFVEDEERKVLEERRKLFEVYHGVERRTNEEDL